MTYFIDCFRWTVMPHCYTPIITMWDEVSYLSIIKTLPLSNTNSHPLIFFFFAIIYRSLFTSRHFSKIPGSDPWKKEGFVLTHSSKGYSPSYQGRHGVRDKRQLITLNLKSGIRERWRLILNWLSLFSLSIETGIPTPGMVLLIFRVIPFSVRSL